MTNRKLRVVAVGAMVGGFLAMGGSAAFGLSDGHAPLATAETGRSAARSSVLHIPGLVGVSESSTTGDHSEWDAVNLFDQTVIGKDESGYVGALAPLGGSVVDPVDEGLCQTTTPGACVQVLPSVADNSYALGSIAYVNVAYFDTVGVERHVEVDALPSDASTNECFTAANAELLHVDYLLPLDLTNDLHLGQAGVREFNCGGGDGGIDIGPITD